MEIEQQQIKDSWHYYSDSAALQLIHREMAQIEN